MPNAIRVLKQFDWPGNVRELKHFIEKILVLGRGERISKEMVQKELFANPQPDSITNPSLPVVIPQSTNKAEIDLILRQLFMLKQDTELIQKMLLNTSVQVNNRTGLTNINALDQNIQHMPDKSLEIVDNIFQYLRDDAIGDMLIKDLEKEAISRTLKFFNNNRRKTAKSLGMSERTLYRKIEEFSLEPKIKKRN